MNRPTMAETARAHGVPVRLAYTRYHRGWSWWKAATTPPRPYFKEWHP